MKRINLTYLLATLLTTLLVAGCVSPDKLISKGQYEKLWDKSFKKAMKGKPLKADWLNGMEVAYRHLQQRDSIRVVQLFQRNNKTAWRDILHVADEVDNRQRKLQRIIPLYDKSGRRGNFQFMEIKPWITSANKNLTADYMQDALRHLKDAKNTGNKKAAIRSVESLESARKHNRDIPGWKGHYNEAIELATSVVKIDIAQGVGYFPDQLIFERKLKDAIQSMRIPFLEIDYGDGKTDYELVLEPRDIVVSAPEESVKSESYEKEITIEDKKVQVWNEQDSIWEDKTQTVKETVTADVREVMQFKAASGQVRFIVYSPMASKPHADRIINAAADFKHIYLKIDGDERALEDEVYEEEPVGYPSDFEMVARVHDALISEVLRHIEMWDWW